MEAISNEEDGNEVGFAAMLVTIILSTILYGRQAFSDRCFQKVSWDTLNNPSVTHKQLLASGRSLSFKDNPLSVLDPNSPAELYLRTGNERRLQGLLADLEQIVAAINQSAVGKIYVCFTGSKQWAKDSLLECFTLKFSYQQPAGFHIYVDWAGVDDKPLAERVTDDLFVSLKQLVLSCPQLPDVFYTHLFVSSIDNKTNLDGVWAGNIHGVREALLHLKSRKGSSSGRVGQTSSAPLPGEEDDQYAPDAAVLSLATAPPRSTSPELPGLSSPTLSAVTSDLNLVASPAKPISESSAGKGQKKPPKSYGSPDRPQDPLDATSHAVTKSSSDESHASIFAAENPGPRAKGDLRRPHELSGSTVMKSSLRKISKKRRAPQNGFSPVDWFEGEMDSVVSKYPRLAMIEETPEDLPPTQRLETPGRSQQTEASTKGRLDFCFD